MIRYTVTVAASGNNKTKTAKTRSSGFGWLLFWLAFLIGIILLFVINREKIRDGLAVLGGLLNNTGTVTSSGPQGEASPEEAPDQGALQNAPPGGTEASPAEPPQTAADEPGGQPAVSRTGAAAVPLQRDKTVKRQVYLIRLDNDGGLVAAKVERSLPSSDSPMRDALEAVIKGPSGEESKRSLLSLIPENVRILGASVRGTTAYVDFSEDFLFNTYGIEGYAGQLRQIVWTATEFGTVKDVQILIDGKRIDYLGEGIWIGSPLSRDSL
ncbi:MAG: GerMN domain-containing protein [Treponema sp.]|jgi:spore germination protein GerM|nr:GerMN domain-containing protein [Treponema sp.]